MRAQELLMGSGINSINELAKKVGISRSRAHQIWHGWGGIGRRHAEKISQALGINKALLLSVEYDSRPFPLGKIRVKKKKIPMNGS